MLALLQHSNVKRKFTPSNLQPWQREDAARVKALLKQASASPEWKSQAAFAEAHGLGTQSNLSQYASGARPLNFETALALARGFGVSVERVSPTYAKQLADIIATAPPAFDAGSDRATTSPPRVGINELDASFLAALRSLEPKLYALLRQTIHSIAVATNPGYHAYVAKIEAFNHKRDSAAKCKATVTKIPRVAEE